MSTKPRGKEGTIIVPCGCRNAWQDQRYGAGLRVWNLCAGKVDRRCTSCGKEAVD